MDRTPLPIIQQGILVPFNGTLLCVQKKLIGRGRERVMEREIVRERDKRTREAWSRIET
jgi:hypothetical protein